MWGKVAWSLQADLILPFALRNKKGADNEYRFRLVRRRRRHRERGK